MCEIRVGHGTDTFNGVTKNVRKDGLANVDVGSGKKLNITRQHCFSIIFKGNTRPLDLVSDDVATARLWVSIILSYNRISNAEIITILLSLVRIDVILSLFVFLGRRIESFVSYHSIVRAAARIRIVSKKFWLMSNTMS